MEAVELISLTPELQRLLTPEQAWHYRIVPKETKNGTLKFYSEQSENGELQNELEILFAKTILIEYANAETIEKTLGKYYRRQESYLSEGKAKVALKKNDNLLHYLIVEARQLGSSDIHLESYEDKCRVRIRIDGHLIERHSIEKADYPSLVNKIKIHANLDISEKRLPQDGRIFFQEEGLKFDIRVSVLPTLYGEKVVLRLLNNNSGAINIQQLGFTETELGFYLDGIKKPHGIILISGPTGSGKTTTLYATLKILNKERSNILTIEDPIEYTLEGVNQVQLKETIGLTFASALRTFLRQDPDIIMLGEIRDAETAQMAIRAALTGHLVLSTIHTNSAWGTISRLVDMGVPSFLLANTLNLSVAQRLLRLLCKKCKTSESFDEKLFPKHFRPVRQVLYHSRPKGCEHCYYTGYKDRKAIYEVIPIDYELSESIKTNNFSVAGLLKEKKIKTLVENAFELFKRGETSIDEVYPILLDNH